MIIIKCKMCGGDMELTADQRYGTCQYCGSTMTLPKIDDEQRASAFNRGNHFRRIGEFDKALVVYERIVQEDETDAEAHWCCALCRFGIEYVKDPMSGEYVPTCHRASFDSFLEDVDYIAALKYADIVAKRQYEVDGEKIAQVQRGILSVSQKEQPFDVFICYKESDNSGNRTVDSTLAQDIYYQLTEEGFRVFFSRITLEDKMGQAYEPYIFAALNSAKAMVVVGTKPEYLNAVWVKNEWSRYLSIVKKDRKKLLIPCYRDMDPYDMPEQLSVLQSYNMSKIGFVQDLIRGISKVIVKEIPVQNTVKETVVVQGEGGANLTALLKRGKMALEDQEWKTADEYFDRVLDMDAECAEAYLGKLLAEQKQPSLQALVNHKKENLKTVACNTLYACEEAVERIQAAVDQYTIPGYLEADEIKGLFEFDLSYSSHQKAYENEIARNTQFWKSNKVYQRAVAFGSSELKQALKQAEEEVTTAAIQMHTDSVSCDRATVEEINQKYQEFLSKVEKNLVDTYEERRRRQDDDFRKSEEEAKQRAEEERLEQERLEKARAQQIKTRKKVAVICTVCAVVLIITGIVVQKVVIPEIEYQKAQSFVDQGDIKQAAMSYGRIFDYRDAKERSLEIWNQIIPEHYTVTAGDSHTVGLKTDGTVLAVGWNYRGLCDVDNWTNIVSVVAGGDHTVGLKADGTVVAIGNNDDGQCDVDNWTDIVSIVAGGNHTVGLRADGTVVAVGDNENGQCDVENWTDVVKVVAGFQHTVGLKANGTVVAVGWNESGQCEVDIWTNIVAVAAGSYRTVGLKADGTVVAVGDNDYGQCNTDNWTDIVAVAAGQGHTVGLKADGTVVAVGWNEPGQCDVDNWTDIVAVAAGRCHTVGLKADGTVVAVGENYYGSCDVDNWTNIKMPN